MQRDGGGLAAAALADQRQRLAASDREADVVDGPHLADDAAQQAALDREEFVQAAHVEQRSRADARAVRAVASLRELSAPMLAGSSQEAAPSHVTCRCRRPRAAAARPRVAHARHEDGQRGWNGQPGGRLNGMRDRARDGRQPCARLAPGCSGSSAAARVCRDASARGRCRRPAPSRRLWPRYMTTTSSAISAMTPMSWVISMIAMPALAAAAAQQVEDLRLRGDVERGGRLVGDQEARVGRRAPWRSSRAGAGRRTARTGTRRCARRAAECRPCAAARSRALARLALASASACSVIASMIWLPIVWTG